MLNNVLIIGGGPTGLMAAILLSELDHIRHITVVELRAKYTRRQILLINPNTWKLLPNEVKTDLFGKSTNGKKPGCFVLPPSRDNWARCYKEKLPLASIEIRILEQTLFKYIKHNLKHKVTIIRPSEGKLHIEFKNNKVFVNMKEINYDMLIGADGGNSHVRQHIIKTRMIKTSPKRYAFIAMSETQPQKLKGIHESASKSRRRKITRTEDKHAGRFFRTQYGAYYIGLALTKPEYDAVMKAKNEENPIPKHIIKRLYAMCDLVNAQCDFPADIVTTSSFPVQVFKSGRYSKLTPKPVYLVGDAAMTTHFFTGTGANNGIAIVETLVNLLKKYPNGRIPVKIYKSKLEALRKTMHKKIMSVMKAQSKEELPQEIVKQGLAKSTHHMTLRPRKPKKTKVKKIPTQKKKTKKAPILSKPLECKTLIKCTVRSKKGPFNTKTLKKNSSVYVGRRPPAWILPPKDVAFFGNKSVGQLYQDGAQISEKCHKYSTVKDLKLLDMSNPKNIRMLISKIKKNEDKNVIRVVTGIDIIELDSRKNFAVLTDPKQMQNLIKMYDIWCGDYIEKNPDKIAVCTEGYFTKSDATKQLYLSKRAGQILCRMCKSCGLDGWIYPPEKTDRANRFRFHEEILLCDPKNSLKLENKGPTC